jgi:hypothetical protein
LTINANSVKNHNMKQEIFLETGCKNRLTHLLQCEKFGLRHGNKQLKK